MAFTYLSGRPSQKQIGYAGTSLPIQLQIPSMNHQVKWNRQVSWVQICLPCSQVFHWLRNLSFQKHDDSIERIQWFYETDWVANTPRRQWCGEQTSTTTPAILTLWHLCVCTILSFWVWAEPGSGFATSRAQQWSPFLIRRDDASRLSYKMSWLPSPTPLSHWLA